VHETRDGGYWLAPFYMATVLMGMAGLIVLPQWLAERPSAMAEPLITSGEKDVASPSPPRSLRLPLVNNTVGYALAALAGLLSATQYALVTLGKRVVASPQALDPLGSWTASFGLGAVAVNAVAVIGVSLTSGPPAIQPHVTRRPGSAAGILYCASLLLVRCLSLSWHSYRMGTLRTKPV